MKQIDTPIVLDHGLTADVDWEGDTPCAHIKGVDLRHRPVALRLNRSQLALLQAVVQEAAPAGAREQDTA